MPRPVLVLFRNDLRLADNPALHAATESGAPVACAFILDDETPGHWRMGGASRWWLHHSLAALSTSLKERGVRLILRRGRFDDEAHTLAGELNARAVYWNRSFEPAPASADKSLGARLTASGIEAHGFNASLLFDPAAIKTGSGTGFRVFTPFWRACLAAPAPRLPLPAPAHLNAAEHASASLSLEALKLLPVKPDWAHGLRASWTPGEAGARDRLASFLDGALGHYADMRDRPDIDGTSRLSAHLHFGEISARSVWHAVQHASAVSPSLERNAAKFLAELGWREFSAHLLFHTPDLPERNLRGEFDAFPWSDDLKALSIWQKGQTGIPIVDAGMRELWQTGTMHNRVRMIAASFLVKHLLIDWRRGAEWFWDTLVDADLANNSASWQWVAGCGADAAPYFRIFNPVLQGEKFDPDGAYVRRFVPELANVPARHIHAPWDAPESVLSQAGVVLGKTYPHPCMDLAIGRKRALEAFSELKKAA